MYDQIYCNWDHIFYKKAPTMPTAMPVARLNIDYLWYLTAYYWAPFCVTLQSPLHYFLPSAATQTHFQDPKKVRFVYDSYVVSENQTKKSHLIFQEVQKQPKMPEAMPVAATDSWGSVCCRLTVCYLILRCRMSVWENIHVLLMWIFVILVFIILLLCLYPSSVPLLCTTQQ